MNTVNKSSFPEEIPTMQVAIPTMQSSGYLSNNLLQNEHQMWFYFSTLAFKLNFSYTFISISKNKAILDNECS